KGKADVGLTSVEGGTQLDYSVSATVSGRLAQVGSRLIDGVAKKMADQFFARFKSLLEPAVPAEGQADTGAAAAPGDSPATSGVNKWLLVAAVAAAVAAGLYFGLS